MTRPIGRRRDAGMLSVCRSRSSGRIAFPKVIFLLILLSLCVAAKASPKSILTSLTRRAKPAVPEKTLTLPQTRMCRSWRVYEADRTRMQRKSTWEIWWVKRKAFYSWVGSCFIWIAPSSVNLNEDAIGKMSSLSHFSVKQPWALE